MKWMMPLVTVCFLVFAFGCQTPAPVTDDFDPEEPEEVEEHEGLLQEEHSTEYEEILVTRLASPLEHPWSVAFLPDGRMLVTERPGRLQLVEEGGEMTEVGGLPEIHAEGQGGLLEVSLHPQYEDNGWIYFTYSQAGENGEGTATTLMRARLQEDRLDDMEELFVQNRFSEPGRHYGSRIVWLEDGTLLMSIGDRGEEPPRAQDTQDHAGSVLRLNDDGSVPEDNPFVGDEDVLDEIYTYGNRNIQAMALNTETGEVWAVDHGPRGGDILYKIEGGNNNGWPVFTRGLDYRTGELKEETVTRDPDEIEGVAVPFYEFAGTHAPAGLAFVSQDRFEQWQGNLLSGGLRSERVMRLVLGEEEVVHEEEILVGEVGRVRDVREGPQGDIFLLTDHEEGALYRIEPREE